MAPGPCQLSFNLMTRNARGLIGSLLIAVGGSFGSSGVHTKTYWLTGLGMVMVLVGVALVERAVNGNRL